MLVDLVILYTTSLPEEWFAEIFEKEGEDKSLYYLKSVIIDIKISLFS